MIRVTNHASVEIARRGLPAEWIETTVMTSDWTTQDPDPSLTRSYKAIADFGDRVLRVVHRPQSSNILIVTAYFDRGARR